MEIFRKLPLISGLRQIVQFCHDSDKGSQTFVGPLYRNILHTLLVYSIQKCGRQANKRQSVGVPGCAPRKLTHFQEI